MPQPVKDLLIWVAFFVALCLWLEAARRRQRPVHGWHPSNVEQISCVSVYRVERPFDYECDS